MELSEKASLVGTLVQFVVQFLCENDGDFNSKGFNVWNRLIVIAILSGIATVFN